MKYFSLLLLSLTFFGCNSTSQQSNEPKETEIISPLFPSIVNTEGDNLILPSNFIYSILFQEGDSVLEKGNKYPAKGDQDLVIYLPKEGSSTTGQLFVSHESQTLNSNLGHGGGASILDIKLESGSWKRTGDIDNINFQNVGYTMRNCGGKTTPYGTILMAEETIPNSPNSLLGHVVENESELNDTLHQNFGWIVEVDPITKKPLRKLTGMGRYSHEDAICLADNKTVILTNDESPAVIFKFISAQEDDFSVGQLYAYSETGEHWIALPMELDSLKEIKNVAINMGATLFARLEWGTLVGDIVYLTETGHDSIDWNNAISKGGIPASQFEKLKYEEGKYNDPYGRVIAIDLENDSLFVQLEGGPTADGGLFSNPDCISNFTWNNEPYLMMSEDIIGLNNKRVSQQAFEAGKGYNEIYVQSLVSKELTRFASAPLGSETTGLYFTPDNQTLFLSIQHPDTNNPAPFNKTSVIAIQGF